MLVTATDIEIGADGVTFRQDVDWLDGEGSMRMQDSRVIVIGERPDHTLVDVTVTVRAGEHAIRMGQTKEAGLAVRVADQIDVLDGGRITNANGQVNEAETFDQIADWVDYSGPISRTETAGIAIFPHPGSDGIPWFTRDYGPAVRQPLAAPGDHPGTRPDAHRGRALCGARRILRGGGCGRALRAVPRGNRLAPVRLRRIPADRRRPPAQPVRPFRRPQHR